MVAPRAAGRGAPGDASAALDARSVPRRGRQGGGREARLWASDKSDSNSNDYSHSSLFMSIVVAKEERGVIHLASGELWVIFVTRRPPSVLLS